MDNGKSISAMNIQLRIACVDGQIHAVRHFLEHGAEPFRLVCTITCINMFVRITDIRSAAALTDSLIAFQ